MVERLFKRNPLLLVARVAKAGLVDLEQACLAGSLVHAVARKAAHSALRVFGALEVGVLACVTTEASLVGLLRSQLRETANLGDIAATVDMGLAGPVAVLATDAFTVVLQREAGMGVGSELLARLLVAGTASLRTDIVSDLGSITVGRWDR